MRFVLITAVWCPSCLVMRPLYERVVNEFNDIPYLRLDIDFDEESKNYQPGKLLPVFILEDEKGNEILRIVGEKKIEHVLSNVKEKVVNK